MNRTSESDLNQSDLITDIHCNGQQCLLMNGGAQSAIGHSHCTFLCRVSIMMIKTRLARDPEAKCCWLKTLPLRDALQQSSVTLAHGVCVCVCVCVLHITHVVRDKNCHSKPFVTVYDCHNISLSLYSGRTNGVNYHFVGCFLLSSRHVIPQHCCIMVNFG